MKKIAIIVSVAIVVSACVGVLSAVVCYKYVKTHFDPRANNTQPKATEIEKQDADDAFPEYIEHINQKASDVQGQVQWGITMYNDDFRYITPSEPVPSASVIKVFIMEYLYTNDGKEGISLNDTINETSVQDLIFSMITKSDNYATNLLIEYTGMEKLNSYFEEQGYDDTLIQRKMLDVQAQNSGKDNYTAIDDVMDFLDKLYTRRETYPYSEMIAIMKKQQVKTKIPRNFPKGVVIANKTGELSNVENDIGIIFTDKGDYAIAFLCSSLSNTYDTRNFISDMSYDVYESLINDAS